MGIFAVLAAVIITVATGTPLHASDIVTKPEWSVGDWWILGNYRYTVVERHGDSYEMVRTIESSSRQSDTPADNGSRGRMAIDGWISEYTDTDGSLKKVLEDSRHQWIRFPMAVGNRWTFNVLSRSRTMGASTRFDYDCQAARWEELELAGRSIRSLRIECQSGTRDSLTRWRHTVWYAPEAKRYVKLVSHYDGGPTLTCSGWSVKP